MRVLDQSGPISMKLLISRVPRIAGGSLRDEKRIARVSPEAGGSYRMAFHRKRKEMAENEAVQQRSGTGEESQSVFYVEPSLNLTRVSRHILSCPSSRTFAFSILDEWRPVSSQ